MTAPATHLEAVAHLFAPGGVHELRAVDVTGRKRTDSGYYDNPAKLLDAATRIAQPTPGIYLTANPVNPALLARSQNAVESYAKVTTSDHDIDSRRWLIVDLDPERPANIPSTDAEHAAAAEKAVAIRAYLSEQGWPAPIVMDSGNGAYLLYRVDLPNDDDSTTLVQRCLAVLGMWFDDGVVKVDQSMFNAARIIRVPGTVNRKGSGADDRPHRLAWITEVPDDPTPVPHELLAALASVPVDQQDKSSDPAADFWNQRGAGFDLEAFVAEHLPDAKGPKDKPDGGQLWVIDVCPFNPDHSRGEAFVGRRSNGRFYAGCRHDSCTWRWPDLRKLFGDAQVATVTAAAPTNGLAPRQVVDPARYFDTSGLKAATLARDVLAFGPLAQGADHIFWAYDGGVWTPNRDVVPHRTAWLLGERWRNTHARNAEGVIASYAPKIYGDPLPEVINFTNGLYYWRLGELREQTPDVLSTVQLGTAWDPAATCPTFDRYLSQVVPEDMIPTVWELIGYLMYSGNPLDKAVMLTGTGRNGKGTFIRVMTALLGKRNVTSVSLHDLTNTRFTTASLFGKLANLAGDIDATYIENTATFKAITGQDLISAEHKGRDRFDFQPWAVPVFSANEIPPSADVTTGYLSRWLVVPFPHSFTGREDRGLTARLTTKAELQGIAARGLAALPGLLERGQFTMSASGATARDDFERDVDQVRRWADECADLAESHPFVPRTQLYADYKGWAYREERKPLGAHKFYTRLEALGAEPLKSPDGTRGFTGVRRRPAALVQQLPEPPR